MNASVTGFSKKPGMMLMSECDDFEESEEVMGSEAFGGSVPSGSYDMLSYSAPPPAPIAAMAPMSMMKRAAGVAAGGLRMEAERAVKRQFKPLDLTKEMGETYYYNRRDIAPSDKKEANLFWLDFIQWVQSQSGSFLSQVSHWPHRVRVRMVLGNRSNTFLSRSFSRTLSSILDHLLMPWRPWLWWM